MTSPFPRAASRSGRNLPDAVRTRHAQVGQRVENGGANMGLGHLPLEGPVVQAVAQLLQPEHHVLGDAAPVVGAAVLPAGESLGVDVLEDGVARVVVSPQNRSLAGWDGRPRAPFGNRRVTAVAVAGAIGRDMRAGRAGFRCRPRQWSSLRCR